MCNILLLLDKTTEEDACFKTRYLQYLLFQTLFHSQLLCVLHTSWWGGIDHIGCGCCGRAKGKDGAQHLFLQTHPSSSWTGQTSSKCLSVFPFFLLLWVLYKSSAQYTLFPDVKQHMVLGTLGMLLRESLFSEESVCCQTSRQLLNSPSPVTLPQYLWSFFWHRTWGCSLSPNPQLSCRIQQLEDRCAERLARHSRVWHPSDYSLMGLHTATGEQAVRWQQWHEAKGLGSLIFWFSKLKYQLLTPSHVISTRALYKSLQYPHHTLPWQHWFYHFSWFKQNQDPVIATCQAF